MRVQIITVLILWITKIALPTGVSASPIYVIREKGGVVRFTSKPPPAGTKAEIFTAKGARYSVLGGRSWQWGNGGKLYADQYLAIIDRTCREQSLDPALVRAVIHAESAFNPRAISPKGALGLMQLMPYTARRHGVKKPLDPEENIEAGTKHLAMLVKRFAGDLRLALAAYNAGEDAVTQYGGIPPYAETKQYVQRVLQLHSRYRTLTG